jgi:hypothetical protein
VQLRNAQIVDDTAGIDLRRYLGSRSAPPARKGLAAAAELGDGVFAAALAQPDAVDVADRRAPRLSYGTVLDEGDDLTSARARSTRRPQQWCPITPPTSEGELPSSMNYLAGEVARRSRPTPKLGGTS